jgi:hypothetical protein
MVELFSYIMDLFEFQMILLIVFKILLMEEKHGFKH